MQPSRQINGFARSTVIRHGPSRLVSVMTLLLLLWLPGPALRAQTSPWLLQPDLCFGYVDSCAQFWSGVWDNTNGGFYTHVNRTGSVSGSGKNTLSQSRNAYGLVRAYQLSGNLEYLDLAHEALEWMIEHAWDDTHGGWFDWMNNQGVPDSPSGSKSAFNQHYALLGLAAYVEATRDSSMRAKLLEGYDYLEDVFWDDRPGFEGYFDRVEHDGSQPAGKSFNATVDAITTHLIPLSLTEDDPRYSLRMAELGEQMRDHLGGSIPEQAIGFAEVFDSDWNPQTGETMTIMGHVLKTAWCLGRIQRQQGGDQLLETAELMLDDVWHLGYDQELGGPYKDFNRLSGEMLMWGNPDTAKAWWQMEQAVTAGLMLEDLLPGSPALEMAAGTVDFFMEHFVDHVHGEVYENRTRHGGQTWGTTKGGGGKAGYHSIELGYYLYLYGSLLLDGGQHAADLHYRFQPSLEERSLRLGPIAASAGEIRIRAAWREGVPWEDVDPLTCTLNLPAGVGGRFLVRFEAAGSGLGEQPPLLAGGFSLLPAAPNPFNGGALLSFRVTRPQQLQLRLYDLRGRLLRDLLSGPQTAGMHQLRFDPEALPSGSYLLELAGVTAASTQRITLLR